MTPTCAVVGTGNIGSDLVEKLLRCDALELRYVAGIDPASSGLARARQLGLHASAEGASWLVTRAPRPDIVFEATSAKAHAANAPLYRRAGIQAIDLTPAALGPGVVPTVNLEAHIDAPNVNMITCGGQATVPIVAAIDDVAPVAYAEIVSTISSRSAGPGTRANIDEFTQTTARALETVGGARVGKAIIILNPAEPPILMRNTVFAAVDAGADTEAIAAAVRRRTAEVARDVPGYRLQADPLFDEVPAQGPCRGARLRVTVLLEVEGAGMVLPTYAGNLDIMTSAAVAVGERIALARRVAA